MSNMRANRTRLKRKEAGTRLKRDVQRDSRGETEVMNMYHAPTHMQEVLGAT